MAHHLWLMFHKSMTSMCKLCLPLGLLAVNKRLQNVNHLLQRLQVGHHLLVELVTLLALGDVGVKVLAVGASAHGGTEDGLDDEGVVGLEGGAVGAAEGVSELLFVVLDVGIQSEGNELEATVMNRMLERGSRQCG